MIAIYLHDSRNECFDRARALVAALGRAAVVVSAHPPRLGWAAEWKLLPDSEPVTLAAWLAANQPEAVVVDGPPEHARAVTESGSTLAVVATPGGGDFGERGSAYADAAMILAPWPQGALDWPAAWAERTVYLGAVGWRAAEEAARAEAFPRSSRRGAVRQCVALWPTHGGPGPRERRDISVETPGWRWTYAPEHDLLEPGPIWSALRHAEVVVCPPTLTNFAALARLGVPAGLVVPERPTRGTAVLAEAAERTAPVVVARGWRRPEEWRGLLEEARALDGTAWAGWNPDAGLAELDGLLAGDTLTGGGNVVVPA